MKWKREKNLCLCSQQQWNASEFLMMMIILNRINCAIRMDMNCVSIFNDASQQHSPLKFSVCKLESFAVSAVARLDLTVFTLCILFSVHCTRFSLYSNHWWIVFRHLSCRKEKPHCHTAAVLLTKAKSLITSGNNERIQSKNSRATPQPAEQIRFFLSRIQLTFALRTVFFFLFTTAKHSKLLCYALLTKQHRLNGRQKNCGKMLNCLLDRFDWRFCSEKKNSTEFVSIWSIQLKNIQFCRGMKIAHFTLNFA